MSKFAVLLVGFAGAAALAGGGLRLASTRLRIEQQRRKVEHDEELEQGFTSVSGLIDRETAGIFADVPGRRGDQPGYLEHEAADEQFVSFRAADLIGLALSGGGIRSATFNLGLLQGLHRLHLLRLFDYLSTVSGGGYVGSFWSAWLRRQTATPGTEAFEAALFPTVRDEGVRPVSHVDTDQERHLREFSGFLAPRWGFFEVETWTAIVALLAGLVPSLLIGVSVIGVTLIA
ncbi:MAG: patatin-like phospholipase family protein [Acidobacteria bacterium]|nr:patatin-like phospholipase family protein [Acidobacteriota bacterium]